MWLSSRKKYKYKGLIAYRKKILRKSQDRKTTVNREGSLSIPVLARKVSRVGIKTKKPPLLGSNGGSCIGLASTYSPATSDAVPSALAGLTALFGKGRGDPRRQRHQRLFAQDFSLAYFFCQLTMLGKKQW